MKKYLCIYLAGICLLIAKNSDAFNFSDPKRSIRGAVVDLTPLFKYWQAQMSTTNQLKRPLTAWKFIRGHIVETKQGGCVVDAQVFSTPMNYEEKRIFLFHPPGQPESEKQE